jgi:hypothetical protein
MVGGEGDDCPNEEVRTKTDIIYSSSLLDFTDKDSPHFKDLKRALHPVDLFSWFGSFQPWKLSHHKRHCNQNNRRLCLIDVANQLRGGVVKES